MDAPFECTWCRHCTSSPECVDMSGVYVDTDADELCLFFATLAHNTRIRCLKLCRINISVKGALALADALWHNTSLQHLDLRWTLIDDTEMCALADALTHNTSLLRFDLSKNWIGEKGGRALKDAVDQSWTCEIWTVYMSVNEASRGLRRRLAMLKDWDREVAPVLAVGLICKHQFYPPFARNLVHQLRESFKTNLLITRP